CVSAILGRVTGRYKSNEVSSGSATGNSFARFTLNVDLIYKRNEDSKIKRGPIPLYVHTEDLACRCPKIKPNK
ncbi:GSCOCG00002746001-RA-CDS, partial [Cotesia congregata]